MKISGFILMTVLGFSGLLLAQANEDEAALAKKLEGINVKLDFPSLRGWKQVHSSELTNANVIAGLRSPDTSARVFISGGQVDPVNDPDFHEDAATKAQLELRWRLIKDKSPGAKLLNSGIKVINGITYLSFHYTTDPPPGGPSPAPIHCAILMTTWNSWRLAVTSAGQFGSDVTHGVEDVTKAAHFIKSTAPAFVGTFEDYHGKVHGFESHLREAGWQTWQRANESFPGNFMAARFGDSTFIVVMVLPLPERGLSIEDHLNATLRVCTRFDNPEAQLKISKIKMKPFDETLSFAGDTNDQTRKSHFGGWFGQGQGRMMFTMAWCDVAKVKDPDATIVSTLVGVQPLTIDHFPPLSLFTRDQRQRHTDVLCEIASQLLRRGRNEDAATLYDQALDCSHDLIATLEAAVIGLQNIGDYGRAETLLKRYWLNFKDSPRAWLLRARLRNAAGEKDKAIEDYASAFQAGLRDENEVLQYMSLLWNSNKLDEAKAFIDGYAKRSPSVRINRWQAVTLARQKDYDHAFEIYEKLIKARPLDVEAALQYGEFANQATKYDLALQMAALLVKENFDGPRTRLLEGWAHYGKKEWREAKLSFETGRKIAPNDALVLDALNAANAALGEGDSSAVKDPIAPLVTPPEVAKRIDEAAKSFKCEEDESAINLLIATQINYHKGKPTVTTVHRKVKILETSAVDVFSTLDVSFDPLSERVFVNHIEVMDEDGKVVAKGKIEDQYVTDPSMDGPATLGRVLRVPIPGLKPGRTLDYLYTKRTVDVDKVMRYTPLWFGSSYPTAVQTVVVEGDVKLVRDVMNEPMKKVAEVINNKEGTMRAWVLTPSPHLRNETCIPRLDTFAPVLALGAPDTDWGKVGKEYLDLVTEKLEAEAEIDALAKKITAEAKTDEEKINLLSRYIREEITYKAIEFGRRARIPNKASRITANHYGDCKDMALLLHQLLAAVGIESHLTLINSHSDLAAPLPDLDQFNHMILHVPKLKAQFIDCTEGKSAGVNLPPNLFDRQGFVLDPAGPKLMPMPKRSDWPTNKLVMDRVVRFDSEGSADVAETIEISSYLAQGMRMFLNGLAPPKRIDSMQAWLQRSCHWQLDKLEALNLQDPNSPLTLKLRYSIPPPTLKETRTVKVPGVMEAEYLELAYQRRRHHPFELPHPLEIDSKVRVITTIPIVTSSLGSFTRESAASDKYCAWAMQAAPTPGNTNEFTISFHTHSPATKGSAEEYGLMRKASADAANAWDVPLSLAR